MPSISLVWDSGSVGPRDSLEVERRVTNILRQSPLKIELTKILITEKGIKLLTCSEQCIDNLQNEEIKTKFKQQLQLTFQPSAERLAKHTLTIRPYNEAFFDFSEEQILTAVRRAAFLTDEANITIWKDKKLKLLKITFARQTDAESVKKVGFRIGSWKIPNHAISYHEYLPILQCMRCFAYESHSTKNCKAANEICSECAKPHHNFRNCPRPTPPRCVSCLKKGNQNPNHRTLANFCPERRKILKRKRKEKQQNESTKEHLPVAKAVSRMLVQHSTTPPVQANSWAATAGKKTGEKPSKMKNHIDATAQSEPPTPATEKKKKFTSKKLLKRILVCTINAHMHNRTFPGTYNTKLNQLLQRNEIPYTDVGDDWDSNAILESIENDLSDMEEEEVSIIRSSPPPPNFSLSAGVSPPYPEVDQSLADRSLEALLQDEDSFGESSPQKPEEGKKKKKKKKKNTEKVKPLSPTRGEKPEEKKGTDEPTEPENTTGVSSAHSLSLAEVSDACTELTADRELTEVEHLQEVAESVFYKDRDILPYEADWIKEFYHEFVKIETLPIWSLLSLPAPLRAGLSYWAAAGRAQHAPEQRDTFVLPYGVVMNQWEIESLEENYITKSIKNHGRRTPEQQEKIRFQELTGQACLTGEEREELKELYRTCAQTRYIDYNSDALNSILLSLYRTSGIAYTINDLEKSKNGNPSADKWISRSIHEARMEDVERTLLEKREYDST